MRRSLALSLLVASVAFPLPARSAEEADAEALVRKYLSTFNAPDPAALSALYAENGLVLPPSGVPVRGRTAIRDYWMKSGRRGLSLVILQKDICGEAGFFVGSYEVRQGSSGEFKRAGGQLERAGLRHPEHGSFVLCVRRGDNGAWQIAADMWNDSGQLGFVPAALPSAP